MRRPCHQKGTRTVLRVVVDGWIDIGNRECTIWKYLCNLCVAQEARRPVIYDRVWVPSCRVWFGIPKCLALQRGGSTYWSAAVAKTVANGQTNPCLCHIWSSIYVTWRGKTLKEKCNIAPSIVRTPLHVMAKGTASRTVATPHPPSTHGGWNLYSDSHPPPEETPTVKSKGRLSSSTYRIHSAPPSPVLPSSAICSITTAMTVPSTGIAPPSRILSPKPQSANSSVEKFSIPCSIKRKAENRGSSCSKYLACQKKAVLALVKPNLFLRYEILPPDTTMLLYDNRLLPVSTLDAYSKHPDQYILCTRAYTIKWSHASR